MNIAKTTSNPPGKNGQVKYLEAIQNDTRFLADKLKTSDDPEAIYYGLQLAESVADDNLFVGIGMTNKDGEVFTGRGNLVGTSSRLDRFYLQRQAKAGRKDVAAYLTPIKLKKSERWRFLTLTMPKLKGCQFAFLMSIFDTAFKKLRGNRKFWKKKIRAGAKSKEFTLGDEWQRQQRNWTLEDDGFHIHAHLIVAAKWIENRKINEKTGEKYYRELAEEWKKALVKSARKHGVVLDFNTDDGLPIVDVRLVKNRGESVGAGEISLKDAITETAKYITKQSTLEHLPVDQLMEISRFLKGKRMIEPLGEANKRKGKGTPKKAVTASSSDSVRNYSTLFETKRDDTDTYVLQKKTIETFSLIRLRCLEMIKDGRIGAAEATIRAAFEKRRAFRKRYLARCYPDADFMTLDGVAFCSDDFTISDFRQRRERPIMKTSPYQRI